MNRLRVFLFFLLTGAVFFFGMFGFEGVLGWAVRMQTGGELGFRGWQWREGRLVFFDVAFRDGLSRFAFQAPRLEAAFSFQRRMPFLQVSLQVEKSYLTIDFDGSSLGQMGSRPRSSGWVDWRVKCPDGVLSCPKLGLESRMSLEKIAPRQLGHVVLESGASSLQIEAFREEKGIRVETRLSQCGASFIQPGLKFLGGDATWERGDVDGWIHVEAFEGEATHSSAHLDVQDAVLCVKGGTVCLSGASLDWDGPLQKEEEGAVSRFRCSYAKGAWRLKHCGFEEVDGQLSYYSDLGIKWEAKGLGQVRGELSPISLSSKGFWSNHSDPWLTMECLFSQGLCTVGSDFTDWTVQMQDIQPFWGRFAQECVLEDPFEMREKFFSDVELGYLQSWEWKEGGISCLFHGNAARFRPEMIEAEHILIARKEGEEVTLGCKAALLHFAPESEQGRFSLEGVDWKCRLSSGDVVRAYDWRSFGEIQEGSLLNSQWEGQIELGLVQNFYSEPIRFGSSFALSGGQQWSMNGHCHHYPFSLEAREEQNIWSLTFEGGAYLFPHGISLEQIAGHLTLGPQDWTLDSAEADVKIGDQLLQIQAVECRKREDAVGFDIRLRQGFLDLARFAGEEKQGVFTFDLERTEMLGEFVQMDPWSWKQPGRIAASWQLSWAHLLTLEPLGLAMGVSIPSALKSSLSGTILFDFCYLHEQLCTFTLKSSPLFLQKAPCLWTLKLQKTIEGWGVHVENEEPRHRGAFDCVLSREGGVWAVKEGKGDFPGQMSCLFHGQCDEKGRGQVVFTEARASSCFLDCLSSLPLQGMIEGKGCLSFDLRSLAYEVDVDLSQMRLESGLFYAKNKKPVHAFFSPSEGLMLQGIDGQLSLDKQSLGECQINLLHWDPFRSSWLFAQTHLHWLEEAGAILSQRGYVTENWTAWDPRHEIDVVADIECAADLSTFSCSMKEGFLPCRGQLRHVQNVFVQINEQKISCDFLYIHQNHDLKIALQANRGDGLVGYLTLEDLTDPLQPSGALAIDWRYASDEGFSVHSIQGSLGGVEASFYLEEADAYSHLIGGAKLNFQKLAAFLPPNVAEVFTELEMGKGYELKGKLQIDRRDASRIFFQGILGGKQIELFGYVFRSCLAQIDIKPDHIQIDQLKISDSAGLFTLDRLVMKGEGKAPWTFMIPQILITEFRPTLLQTAGGTGGEISPLVIRKMVFRDMQGILEDRNTYTAEGELYFINSYKRERTIFDIPSEVLGRIIGLDIELLVPVCGTLRYALQEGRVRITSLEDAYSEGRRSKFFLASATHSPEVDLDGNVQIQVKMKQYVLFKLTEAFTISIDGTLKHPQYHLQKNRK